jgi:hypothetical protein
MKFIFSKKSLLIFTLILLGFLGVGREVGAVDSCATHNVYGWGWNPHIGWISLNGEQLDGCTGGYCEFAVEVVDTGDVTGYAWNGWGTTGYWICFGESCAAVMDYTYFPGTGGLGSSYSGEVTGNINGWAKFLGWGDDGWIKLDGADYAMNIDRWGSAESFYYAIKAFLTAPPDYFSSDVGGYSWNNKIGWIKWYSVCADSEENELGVVVGDGYGAPLAGWGLSTDLDSEDRDKCGGDCIDTVADCEAVANEYLGVTIPVGSYYDVEDETRILSDLVELRCNLLRGEINPDGSENTNDKCSDLLDNDCDGDIDCADLDCYGSPTGPSDLDGNGDECGFIRLSWTGGLGMTGGSAYCDSSEEGPDIDEFVIYRALYNGSGCSFLSSDDFNLIGTKTYGDIVGGTTTSYEYDDYSVIPRVEYCYKVNRRQTIVEGELTTTTETTADISGPFETVCYPGSEWGEN